MRFISIIPFLILLLQSGVLFSQQAIYPYDRVKENAPFTQWLEQSTDQQMEIASMLPKKQKEYVTEAFTQRHDFLLSLLNDGQLFFENDLSKKVKEVCNKIELSNPEVKGLIHEYVLMNPSVNAVNMGSGCILIYTGILERLQNDGQLAFVLCHEMAHQVMDHVNLQIQQNAERVTSKELQDSIQKILKEEYKVVTKLSNLLIPGLAKQMQYSRAKELQADSLGFIFFRKAGYPAGDAIACLKMLDESDEELFKQVPDFKEYFNQDSIQFSDDWIAEEYASSLALLASQSRKEDTLKELLKTHPDIDIRITALKRQLGANADQAISVASANSFAQINLLALINNAYEYYQNNNFCRAFFLGYNIQVRYPELAFPRYLNSIMLSRMAILRKDHMTGKVLDLQDESYAESYEEIVDFLWALDEREYAQLGYWLVRPCTPDYSDEFQMKALLYSSIAMRRTSEFKALYQHYITIDNSSEDFLYFQRIMESKTK